MKKISSKSSQVLEGLLNYLDERNEQDILPEVTKSLEAKVEKNDNDNKIIISSAIRLSDKQIGQIKSVVLKKLGRKMPAVNKIEKKLLGGFTLRVNDWFLDSSLNFQIINLKRLMLSS